jgi:flagellar basal body-associated protein FliL
MGTFMRILQRLSTQPYNPYVAERQDILTHSLRDEAFNKILFGLTEDDRIDLHEVRYYIELVRAIALKTIRSISLAAMDTPAGKDTSWPSITDSIAVNEWARLAQDMGSYLRLIGTLLDEITPESHKW